MLGQSTPEDDERISAVDAVASNDVWAVGDVGLRLQDNRQIEIQHWDGNAWSFVEADQVSGNNVLDGVAAVSADDVWAVGSQDTHGGVGRNRALIEHWDGRSWRAVAIPDPAGTESLAKIAAVSANDIWAVESVVPDLKSQPLAMHWNGASWSVVPVPSVDRDLPLSDVVALASNNVWAVGMVFDFSWPSHSQGIIMHWDGTAWRLVPSPVTGPYDADGLAAITAISASDIWAIGNSVKQNQQTLAEHWNGRAWKFTAAPNSFLMNDIAAVSSDDVWAVGWMISSSIIEHWDGRRWRIVPSP